MNIISRYNQRIYWVSLLLIFLITACTGVQYTLKGGKIPGQTFSIENFENAAPLGNPNLNIIIQDALRDRLIRESGLKYISENGDAHFKGTVTNYTISPVLGTGEATANLNRLTITLQITYNNVIIEKNNFSKSFSDFDDFQSSEDISSVEDELLKKISEKLVNQIFNQVLVDW